MPYELLYTRSIASDDRVRFTDVPITSPSIMVDVLSLRSPYYRIAGYAYSIVSDGLIDYERGKGYTLPFGKNRLLFPDAVLPYYLEFFPKWGTKQAIISVYTGNPSPPVPPAAWKPIPNYSFEFRIAQTPNRLEYRTPIGSTIIQSMADGIIEGGYSFDYVQWKKSDGTFWYAAISDLSFEGATTEASYLQFKSYPETVIF